MTSAGRGCDGDGEGDGDSDGDGDAKNLLLECYYPPGRSLVSHAPNTAMLQ